ncbi:MAG: DUF998 domain-containing protein [bacterium]
MSNSPLAALLRWAGLCGVLAAAVYVLTVVLGGLLSPGYSHVGQAISELVATGAPNRAVLDFLFAVYGILLLLFGQGLVVAGSLHRSRSLVASGAMVIVCTAAGLAMSPLPMDPRGAPATLAGSLHLVMAGITSLATILALFFGAAGFGRVAPLAALKPVTRVLGFVVVGTGLLAAAAPALAPSVMGVFERLTIGAFMAWLVLAGSTLARNAAALVPAHPEPA